MAKKSIVNLIGLCILLLPLVSAVTLNQFDDSTRGGNFTFNGNHNLTKYVTLPLNVNITSAILTYNGHIINKSYLLYNNFSINHYCDPGVDNCNNAFDNSFSTYARRQTLAGSEGYNIYENFTNTNRSYINITFKGGYQSTGIGNSGYIALSCKNGSNWIEIYRNNWAGTHGLTSYTSTNITINNDCKQTDIIQTKAYLFNVRTGGYAEAVYYEMSLFSNESLPTATTLNFGDVIGYTVNKSVISDNVLTYTTILMTSKDLCTCDGCILSSNTCKLPFIIDSHTQGILEYKLLSITYKPYTSIINITIKDSDLKTIITGENFTIQLVGDYNQSQNNTINGYSRFNYGFNVANVMDTVSMRVFESEGTDYSITILNENIVQGEHYNYSIYITNTSDLDLTNLVSFHVSDENGNPLEGAEIIVKKQDPSTNTYITVTEITTNTNGQATTILQVDTVFYRFLVTYEGKNIYTNLEPITLSLSDDDIYIIGAVGDQLSKYYDGFSNTIVDLDYVNVTNTTGYFTADYSSPETIEFCFMIYIINSSGNVYVEGYCQNSTSGSLTSSTFNPNNITYYVAKGFVDPKDEYGARLKAQIARYIGEPITMIDKTEALILIIVLLLFCGLGFYIKPVIGLIILIIGSIGIAISHLVPSFNMGIAMAIVSLAIISIFTVTKTNELQS